MMDSHPTGQRARSLVVGEQLSQQPMHQRHQQHSQQDRHQQAPQQHPQRQQRGDGSVRPPDQREAPFTRASATTASPEAVNPSDANAQQPPSEPAKKKRKPRHRRRGKRRPSFIDSQDTADPAETTVPALDVSPPQRPAFYHGSTLSHTSLESEALLDHR
jgi:hypothetical protein